jgi:hypothetical protein
MAGSNRKGRLSKGENQEKAKHRKQISMNVV